MSAAMMSDHPDVLEMTSMQAKQLAMALLHADSEKEVVEILTELGYWNDPAVWRLYGDDENNFRTIGAQQARPDSALVEKLVNSVDARLMDACARSGLAPDAATAPQSIDEARKAFFGSVDRTELAKGITVAATGARPHQEGMPCLTICDIGEGQTPGDVPETFLSIDRKNKLRIPFVQGKFNMGGTGALMFCGRRKLQLLITRRDPKIIVGGADSTAALWTVTVVRRESPPEGPGQVRNPYFKYLCPVGVREQPGLGDVLTFSADELPMMPEGRTAYVRPMQWGSCIKLYNYDMRGFKGHILRKGGLLQRLEILLPEVALPIRMHECRKGLRGHAGSFDTNLIGLRERLENSRGDNLEAGYPASLTLNVQGQPMRAKIYAFKGDKADSYRADQGIVFTVNGQTHGAVSKTFFERRKVKMGRLAKALLICVDCTDISVEARADLFKNSRDRLSAGDLRKDIEEELESQIRHHPGLRELKERRRRDEVVERLKDSKPLEDVIGSIFKTSPSLSRLFLVGQRLSRPFKAGASAMDGNGGPNPGCGEFKGQRHPTFFRFEKLKDGERLERTNQHGLRCRIKFLTDVENEYFVRETDRGGYRVEVIEGALDGQELTTSVNLYNGVANWSVAIPEEDVAIGDSLTLQFTVDDDVLDKPIVNIAKIAIAQRSKSVAGNGRRRGSNGTGTHGSGGSGKNKGSSGNGQQNNPAGIQLPEIRKVRRDGWDSRGFDEYSACAAVDDGTGDEDDERSSYTFYINVDNIYLQTDIKQRREDPALVEARFVYGNVLLGLALIHDNKRNGAASKSEHLDEDDEVPVERKIEEVSRALGPFLVPMIEYLGGLQEEEVSQLASVADED